MIVFLVVDDSKPRRVTFAYYTVYIRPNRKPPSRLLTGFIGR